MDALTTPAASPPAYVSEKCKFPKPIIKINDGLMLNKYYDKWLKEKGLRTLKDVDVEKLHHILSTINDRDDFFYNIKCIDDNKFLDIKCNKGIFEPKCAAGKGGKKTKNKRSLHQRTQ